MVSLSVKKNRSHALGMRLLCLLTVFITTAVFCLTGCAGRPASARTCIVSSPNGKTALYAAQNENGNILSVLYNGEEVVLLSRSGMFSRVKAKVNGRNTEGYVLDGSIRPAEQPSLDCLTVVDTADATYTYDEMLADIEALRTDYPSLVRVYDLTITSDGRRIPVMEIGNADASRHILLHASIHAREYMTSQLLMAQAEEALSEWEECREYKDVCFHLIPMVNPDGVSISQFGADGIRDAELRSQVLAMAESNRKPQQSMDDYFARWKANARGVDLNVNFDALWAKAKTTDGPCAAGYKGTGPLSEIETQALADYTLKRSWDLTISYHAYGSILYWEFMEEGEDLKRTRSLLKEVMDLTAYTEVPKMTEANFSCAGYKDWVLQTLHVPSLTMEIGTCNCPMPASEFPSVWDRTQGLWKALARWAEKQ